MIFLKSIIFPKDKKRAYPFCVPSIYDISNVDFDKITIFAGSNGSGKSTLINVIAEKLGAQKALGNQSGSFHWFIEHCQCNYSLDEHYRLIPPVACKLIKSEDIMNTITDVRRGNEKIDKQFSFAKGFADSEAGKLGYAEATGAGMCDEDLTNDQRFMRSRLGDYNKAHQLEIIKKQEYSNGESAMQYFMETMLEENSLYLLDEPENSLSPMLQFELMKFIADSVRFFNCQFIIATHSPFLMSIKDSKIYDLDNIPVKTREWYELENIKAYAGLFFENKTKFKV